METLIIKLGATGDVVRTTPLLRRFQSQVTWLTAPMNLELVQGIHRSLRCFSWDNRTSALDRDYDLAINLEDTIDVALFLKSVRATEVFGAYLKADDSLGYTENSKPWFDLSLISSYGREEADRLKFRNRRTYQEMIFNGLGLSFAGDTYLLPDPKETGLAGDVAIAADSGKVWPMKEWRHYSELKERLQEQGWTVNMLPKRPSLLEHLADVKNHRCLVGGDSLPMHLALGIGTRCVTLFNCTSPWEIYDYGIQKKIVSPLLGEFFYKRGYDRRATTAITIDEVLDAVLSQLESAVPADNRVIAK
jgi:heptosyltransferase II